MDQSSAICQFFVVPNKVFTEFYGIGYDATFTRRTHYKLNGIYRQKSRLSCKCKC